jgi:probable HAF family extracellular repeat protein
MHIAAPRTLLAVFVLAGASCAAGAGDWPRYQVNPLALPEGAGFGAAYTVNRVGAAAGEIWIDLQDQPPAIWYPDGAVAVLPGSGFAADMNARGEVVGQLSGEAIAESFIVKRGDYRMIPSTQLVAVNDAGTLADNTTTDQHRAYLYKPRTGKQEVINTLGGSEVWILRMNNLDHLIGYATSGSRNGHATGFFWRDGVMTDLGTCDPAALNDHDEVVGTWAAGPGGVCLWKDGVVRKVALPPGVQSIIPEAISSSHLVVGQIYYLPGFGPPGANGFVYRDGDMQRLDDLLDAGSSGWSITTLYDVNDDGVMVGIGTFEGVDYGVKLVPVRQP